MRQPRLVLGLACALAFAGAGLARADVPSEPSQVLDAYVRQPQESYGWTLKSTEARDGVTLHRLRLDSQTWKSGPWTHRLNVIVPPPAQGERARPGHVLLVIAGSGAEERLLALAHGLALRLGVPLAVLHDVPNQPLFAEEHGGRGLREDAAIAYTFTQYVRTGDAEWLLLLPMVRSAVAAMDALGELSDRLAQEDSSWAFGRLEKFVTTGASKRGWTTWLSGAVDDRVIGIAPMVYDNLNLRAQLRHHFHTWGAASPSIHDYTDSGLLRFLESPTPRSEALVRIVDPYSYAERLDLPKIALLGTNDSYWPVDAVQLYRGGLPGELSTHYVPNGGHGAGLSVIGALAGFFEAVTGRTPPLPPVRMHLLPGEGAARVELAQGDRERVRGARVWGALQAKRDFRQAEWRSVPAAAVDGGWSAALPAELLGGEGYGAFLGEVELTDSQGETFLVHSPVQVWQLGPREKK